MKRTHLGPIAALLLALLVGCGPARPTDAPPTSPPTDPPTAAALSSPTPRPSPTEAATPKPTPTWVPTLPPAHPPTTEPSAAPAAELLALMDAIEAEMEELRGLDETAPLTRTLMTRQELTAYLEREFAEEYPPDEVARDVRVMAAFDFAPEDFDLQGVILDLYSSQVLGLYDDEEDTFYIVSADEPATDPAEAFDLLDRVTFAHEYVHGLQDQHFRLDEFVDEDRLNDDQLLARMALVEGDASLAMTEYLMAHLFEVSAEELQSLLEREAEGSQEALAAAPPIIRETFEFPYVYGAEFVSRLQEQGWAAVDAAFADPPQSTEQILHPEKYLARDEPQLVALPPLTDTLGAGWRLLETETLGEFQLDLYLAQQVDAATADLASQGWDGDRYALYVQDGAETLVYATVWDSPQDREEFVAAYTQYAEGKYGAAAVRTGPAERWWETPDQTAVLAWWDAAALVILGPDRETAARVLAVVKP